MKQKEKWASHFIYKHFGDIKTPTNQMKAMYSAHIAGQEFIKNKIISLLHDYPYVQNMIQNLGEEDVLE